MRRYDINIDIDYYFSDCHKESNEIIESQNLYPCETTKQPKKPLIIAIIKGFSILGSMIK